MFISWGRTFKFLSYFCAFGILLAVIAMGCIFAICSNNIVQGTDVQGPIKIFDIQAIFGQVGVAMFVFEGNAVILNLRDEARDRKNFPSTLKVSIITTIGVFMVFASIGYIAFKDETEDILTLNLEMTPFTIFIRLCTCVNAMVSYPL
jgi:amino acid permease